MDAFLKISKNLSPYEATIWLFILRKTYGYNKKEAWIKFKELEELTGISFPHISRTKKKLLIRNMIICNSKLTGIQKDYEKWKLPKRATSKKIPKQVTKDTHIGNKKVPKRVTRRRVYKVFKDSIKDNIKDIWDFYLNIFKGTYEPRKLTKKIKEKIGTRLKEYSVDEIKEALTNMRANKFLCGENDNGKVYAKPEYCFRSDEKIEEWLTKNLKPGKKIYSPGDKINWED